MVSNICFHTTFVWTGDFKINFDCSESVVHKLTKSLDLNWPLLCISVLTRRNNLSLNNLKNIQRYITL